MVLSSQSIRSDGRRMMSSDGRRIRRRGWKLFALLGLVVVFGWLGWRFFGPHSEVPASEIRAVDTTEKVDLSPGNSLAEIPAATIEVDSAAPKMAPKATKTVIGETNANQNVIGDPAPNANQKQVVNGAQQSATQSTQQPVQQSVTATNQNISTPEEIAMKYEDKMVILSSLVSGGPFLGLLGTVWGVMVTFGALTEKASIAQLAPGVCGALVTTTLGLLVAIPATFGYNYLLTQVKIMSTELENFASTLADRVELELEAEARLNFEQQQQRELLRRAAAQAAVVSAPASVAPMAAAEPATPGELPGWEDAQ